MKNTKGKFVYKNEKCMRDMHSFYDKIDYNYDKTLHLKIR